MTTIIYAHPWNGSFNHTILTTVIDRLRELGENHTLLDLYADRFSPVMTEAELSTYGKGTTDDPLVIRYQQALTIAHRVIFIFPVWWGEVPAIVKGFFDKVMLPGFGYTTTEQGALLPGLQVAQTMVITTSESASIVSAPYFEGYLLPVTLASVGLSGTVWMNCDQTSSGTDEHRRAFLSAVAASIK